MEITMTLNGHSINIDTDTSTSLLQMLRKENLMSVKCGCEKGICGACTVLLDGKAVPSCLVPSPVANNTSVETLEGFIESDDYKDIISGFEQAGIKLCGFCNAGKIFAAYELLNKKNKPEKEEIIQMTKSFPCSCTEPSQLANGILFALANRHRRKALKKSRL